MIYFFSLVIEIYYQPSLSPLIGSPSNAVISNMYKILSEKILVTLTFLKKIDSLTLRTLRYSK